MDVDLSKVKSSKTRLILKDAITSADAVEKAGLRWEATAIRRLVRSRLTSNTTNAVLASDLRKALSPPQTTQENE